MKKCSPAFLIATLSTDRTGTEDIALRKLDRRVVPSPFLVKGGRLPRLADGALNEDALHGPVFLAKKIMGPRPHAKSLGYSLARMILPRESNDEKFDQFRDQISSLLASHQGDNLQASSVKAIHMRTRTEKRSGRNHLVAGEHWVYDQLLKKAAEKHDFDFNFDWRPNEAIPEDFLAKGGRLPRLAAGGIRTAAWRRSRAKSPRNCSATREGITSSATQALASTSPWSRVTSCCHAASGWRTCRAWRGGGFAQAGRWWHTRRLSNWNWRFHQPSLHCRQHIAACKSRKRRMSLAVVVLAPAVVQSATKPCIGTKPWHS